MRLVDELLVAALDKREAVPEEGFGLRRARRARPTNAVAGCGGELAVGVIGEGAGRVAIGDRENLVEVAVGVGLVALLDRELDEGLRMKRISCPIGVIGVIFEARPDALVQISTLCLKSGNCSILKGGSETAQTNKALFELIHAAAVEAGMPAECMFQVEAREDIGKLLACDQSVDLLIPRGSNSFVRYIMDNTRIPVMGHADGICHIYIDEAADVDSAVPVVIRCGAIPRPRQ